MKTVIETLIEARIENVKSYAIESSTAKYLEDVVKTLLGGKRAKVVYAFSINEVSFVENYNK